MKHWRDFYLIQLGSILHAIGTRCGQFAIAWWVLQTTGNNEAFAFFVAIGTLADVLSRGLFGWLGDRFERCRLVAACYLVAAIATAVPVLLVFLSFYSPLLLGLSVVLSGMSLGVREPLHGSMLPMLVPAEKLAHAIRIRSAASSSTSFLAPAVAGVVLGPLGVGYTLVVNLLLTVVALLLSTRIRSSTNVMAGAMAGNPLQDWYHRTREGFVAAYRVKPEFHLALLALAINFSLYPLFGVLVPALIQRTYPQSTWVLGATEGSFAIGLVLGSLGFVSFFNRLLGRSFTVFLGFAQIGLAMIVCGYILSVARSDALTFALLSGPAFFLGGIGLTMVTVNTGLLRSLATPNGYRNRMMSTVAFLSGLAIPLGSILGGILATQLGIGMAIICLGTFIVASAILGSLSRSLAEALSLSEEAMSNAYERKYPHAFK